MLISPEQARLAFDGVLLGEKRIDWWYGYWKTYYHEGQIVVCVYSDTQFPNDDSLIVGEIIESHELDKYVDEAAIKLYETLRSQDEKAHNQS